MAFAVVGGGASGLSCGFRLKQAGRSVAVLERAARPGGCVKTLRRDGWTFELGPSTITDATGAIARLCAAAGIGERLREARPEAERRYIYKASPGPGGAGRLLPLPASPPAFFRSPILPPLARLRLLREPFIKPRRDPAEESVADFVRRRLGQPWLDYLVGPFVSGVYAGDPEKLSLRWAVRVIYGLEQEHGSLIRGAIARRKGPAPRGRPVSFPGGLEEFTGTLAAALGEDLRLETEVAALRREDGGFVLDTRGPGAGEARLRARQVILAAPADAAGRLLAGLAPGRGDSLGDIPYAAVVNVALGFRDPALAARVGGFGFLVPRVEGLRLLGCLYSSSIFPDRAPQESIGLTAILGGATDPEAAAMKEGALLEIVLRELREALGPMPDPVFRRIERWPRAIPQYNLGHGRFVALAHS
ncbi:MAG: protoporphyrinogen oxidase, partial [Myxococcota bacterium]